MVKIYFYQAECGDAGRIHYIGSDGEPHNILIDAGYVRTYKHVLCDELQKISLLNNSIDLWILSHIHDDHIGGVVSYIKSIKNNVTKDIVKEWYYNSPRSSLVFNSGINKDLISNPKSIDQGDYVYEYLLQENKLLEKDISTQFPTRDLYGLKLTVLSPTPTKLEKLREKYSKSENKILEGNEVTSISDAKAVKKHDFDIPIESFDLKNWEEDESIENGSSIAVLTEFLEKKVLWLADAHPSIIVSQLKKMGYSMTNPLKCDYVKVTHHGSKGNNSIELYELIQSNNYIMSVDGKNKHYLPTKECIARILRNDNRPKDSHYNFYFTYNDEVLKSIFNIDGKEVFDKWRFTVHFLSDKKYYSF